MCVSGEAMEDMRSAILKTREQQATKEWVSVSQRSSEYCSSRGQEEGGDIREVTEVA